MSGALSIQQIDNMRYAILSNLQKLDQNKHLIRSQDRTTLVNLHNQILHIYDNMINVRQVELSDPYRSATAPNYNKMQSMKTVVYNRDGSTRLVDPSSLNTGEEWEQMFSPSMLINPPCYQMPPQTLTNIQRIKTASEFSRLKGL